MEPKIHILAEINLLITKHTKGGLNYSESHLTPYKGLPFKNQTDLANELNNLFLKVVGRHQERYKTLYNKARALEKRLSEKTKVPEEKFKERANSAIKKLHYQRRMSGAAAYYAREKQLKLSKEIGRLKEFIETKGGKVMPINL